MAPVRERALDRAFSPVSPNRESSPSVGAVWAVTIRMMVVLPAPLRPTRP